MGEATDGDPNEPSLPAQERLLNLYIQLEQACHQGLPSSVATPSPMVVPTLPTLPALPALPPLPSQVFHQHQVVYLMPNYVLT